MADHHDSQLYHTSRAPSSQRDAAFSDIFGAAPSGRSQTMTSQPSYAPQGGRSQTMNSASTHGGYSQGPPASPHYPKQRPQQQQQYPPSPRQVGYPQPGAANGYPPPQQHHQQYQQSHHQHQQPLQQQQQHHQQQQLPRIQTQPQYLPSPTHPERRPYAQPVRMQPSAPTMNPGAQKPLPQRSYYPPPALNNDPYRSRSMAASTSAPPAQYGLPVHRQGVLQPQGQYVSRTTAHGRVVPERHDERTMSLTSYAHERDHAQTMSGRVIPHRRKDSGGSDYPAPEQQRLNSLPGGNSASFNPASKPRTPSYASTSSSITAVAPSVSSVNSDGHRNSLPKVSSTGGVQTGGIPVTPSGRKAPLVYPALLSRVADVFKQRMVVGDRLKNELTYKSAFTGADGVDVISYIIKTSDRNLALLLGRALDAQKFFHDVTYEHRLRDSSNEVYQFRDGLVDEAHEVNGVFTLLTECYSPTCTPNQLCYSIACPRRLEQQARLNLKPQPGLKRQDSIHNEDEKEQKLWIHSVSKEIAEGVSDKEKKRQEVIMEAIYTERDFVKDLEYLRDFWMKPLRSTNPQNPSPIPEHRREKFIRTVFGNALEVHAVNSRLAEALTRRQQQSPVVHNIGDIFLEYVQLFEPFIKYGSNQLYGKFEFEKEKSNNPLFAKFVEETERMKESRKLELNGYLTKPTTRLARYPLLLEAVFKATADDNPDKKDLPKAVELVRKFLTKVNIESGKSENHFNLMQLNQSLIFRPGEMVDLKLQEEGRQLIFKGILKKSDAGGDIQCFLFDHALLMVRVKILNKREQYKVYRKPIPLDLLVITEMEEFTPRGGTAKRPGSSLIPGTKVNPLKGNNPGDFNTREKGYPITFQHLGKRGYTVPLFAASIVSRKKWIEHIETQQNVLRERSSIFNHTILCENFFSHGNKVNCLVPIDGGRKLVYGTDTGIYVSDRKPKDTVLAQPKKVIEITKVDQVDVLEEYQMLLLLTEKNLMQVPLAGLDPEETTLANKRPKKIMGHTSFFKAGVCLGRVLVCSVKTSTLSSTVKVLEPQDTLSRGKKQPAYRKLLPQGGHEALKPFKEFYIPTESTSIHFLKSKLCVGCAKGFEVVSLETLETQSLLDPADTSLDFIQRRDNVNKPMKPIAIYRLNGEFLLNYSDYSFFVNRNGWRARPDWQIAWEGQPMAFALSPPYILAFEPSFIEIRHIDTGNLITIVTGKNIRMLHESTREILYAYEDDITGDDVVASLDFWQKMG